MATDPWRETGARQIGHIAGQSEWSSSATLPVTQVSIGEEPPKPTAAHKACIAELLLRFPCPRDVDPDSYQARASLLAKDCAALQPALLRKACDRVAQTAKGLPYASEILSAAREIVAERQASQTAPSGGSEPWGNRGFPTRSFAPGSAEHRQWIADVNRYQRANDKPSRLVLDEGSQQSRVVLLADGWTCNGDGTVTAPESRQAA